VFDFKDISLQEVCSLTATFAAAILHSQIGNRSSFHPYHLLLQETLHGYHFRVKLDILPEETFEDFSSRESDVLLITVTSQ